MITFEQLPNEIRLLRDEVSQLSQFLRTKDSTSKDLENPIDIKECAKLIKVSIPTLYGYTSRNEIPFSKNGKRLLFFRSDILEWLKSFQNKSVSDIENEADNFLAAKK